MRPNVLRACLLAGALLALVPATAQGSVPHTVQPGETLWSIASANGIGTQTLAAANGISSEAQVVIGTTLQLPGPGQTSASGSPAASGAPVASGSAGPSTVSAIAGQHGVPPALAAAIAHHESGFNNAMVSSTGARGVMQVMPGTFDYVHRVLGAGPHDPSSPSENTTAGVLYLRQLLQETGGDQSAAVASYYQGPASVRQNGLLPDTQQYVANVMALKARYGG
ncbi:MAG TPA: transglycosylase SLT domain-containing protein [Thermoleophilaceae bacterium]|nr:transglycosylase SLT domain-containing protein [Thermoleophilaceae bacterium]